jgi:hypothetical protein
MFKVIMFSCPFGKKAVPLISSLYDGNVNPMPKFQAFNVSPIDM